MTEHCNQSFAIERDRLLQEIEKIKEELIKSKQSEQELQYINSELKQKLFNAMNTASSQKV